MNPLFNSTLVFVVLAESCIIVILLAVVFFQCWATRRLRRTAEALKKNIEDTPRPASGMRLIDASPAPKSYGWTGDDSEVATVCNDEGRLNATMTGPYGSMHPLIPKPSDLSDKSKVTHMPEHTFLTYGDYYRAMGGSAISLSLHSSTSLVPPPSPAYLRTHEPSRLATSTLPAEYGKSRPAERAADEHLENRAGVGIPSPSRATTLDKPEEGIRSPSNHTSTTPSAPDRPSNPLYITAPLSSTPPRNQTTSGGSEGVPSPPSAPRRGTRSRTASTSWRPQQSSRLELRRGLSDIASNSTIGDRADGFNGGAALGAVCHGRRSRSMPRSPTKSQAKGEFRKEGPPTPKPSSKVTVGGVAISASPSSSFFDD